MVERRAMPEPKDGEALLRVRYISLDAANRAWMHGATYRSAVEANSVMAGGAIAEVVSSKAPGLGRLATSCSATPAGRNLPPCRQKHLTKMPKLEPMTHLLSVFGIAGLTAYFGLLEVGKPKEGETVVVSAAGGLGRLDRRADRQDQGCRVVGIAGGADKCNWLTSSSASMPRSTTRTARCSRRCAPRRPKGIDVYFDNVGGDILGSLPAADEQLRPHRLLRRDLAI